MPRFGVPDSVSKDTAPEYQVFPSWTALTALLAIGDTAAEPP